MASKTIEKSEIIVSASQNNEMLFLITEGEVMASAPGIKMTLTKGDVIGSIEVGFDAHFFSYMASEDTTIIPIPLDSFFAMLQKKNDFSAYIYKSAIRQILECSNQLFKNMGEAKGVYTLAVEYYEFYRSLCVKVGVDPTPLDGLFTQGEMVDDTDVSEHIKGYYNDISTVITDGRKVSPEFLDVFIRKLSRDSRAVVLGSKKVFAYLATIGHYLLDEPGKDLYGILTDSYFSTAFSAVSDQILSKIQELESFLNKKLYINANRYFERTSAFEMKIERAKLREDHSEDEKEIFKLLENSVDQILDFGGFDEKTVNDFKSLLISYKNLADPRGQDDASRHIRLDITNYFYKFYEAVALKVLKGHPPTKVILMFLEFGYMDEELCTKEDLFYLYEKAGSGYTSPEKGVFTFFEWIEAIYNGQRLPSKNDFDVDYEAFVHEQKVKNQITAEQEKKAMNDREAMVKYELKNMFLSANKVTFGLITIFCPVFNSVNVMKTLPDDLVTAGKAIECLDYVRSLDFQLFYRDTVYSNEKAGIKGEYINFEMLPDFILLPNVGTRSLFWQEIQGRARNTHSRFMLPVFDLEDIKVQMLHMCGEYRWEMCKRVQGARWNDVTDPSLTSEYFDYAQFYRKNHDLSPDAKEKIKLQLQRAKNSFKEMFVMDYMVWVAYESDGSPRLNKVTRTILSKYCPFPVQVRTKLAQNPSYKDLIEYYEKHQAQKIHRFENIIQKAKNLGVPVPSEIEGELEYMKA